MSSSETLAAAAHLHVMLRRKTGRVTDTEWMASHADYARAMVALARESAASDGHVDLLPLAERLENLMGLKAPPPARESRAPRADNDSTFEAAGQVAAAQAHEALASRYIGRLR